MKWVIQIIHKHQLLSQSIYQMEQKTSITAKLHFIFSSIVFRMSYCSRLRRSQQHDAHKMSKVRSFWRPQSRDFRAKCARKRLAEASMNSNQNDSVLKSVDKSKLDFLHKVSYDFCGDLGDFGLVWCRKGVIVQ